MAANPLGAFRRALRLLAPPADAASGRGGGGIVLQPYRGYGSREQVFLMGRVFRQPGLGASGRDGAPPSGGGAIDLGRRFLRRGIADAAVVARLGGAEQRVATDQDGYFRVHIRPAQPLPADRLWHDMRLELVGPARVEATGKLFIPPETCRHVVISDIDDTVMLTGVAGKARMLWRLFMLGAQDRVAFPGVAAFLGALHRGVSGAELNPMLYVSRAPWDLYEVLDAFFQLHRIPVGPVLFLREWGLTLGNPLPRRGKGHKLALIRAMLALYGELPFILIGDSGQRDPEIYAQVVREHPGRVLVAYIRNVSRDPERHHAIEALAAEVAAVGSSLVLAADSLAMAEHAAGHGLIAPEALSEVRAEKTVQQEGEPVSRPTYEVARPSPGTTREAVEQGQLRRVLEKGTGDELPPNVVVGPQGPAPLEKAIQPPRPIGPSGKVGEG